MAIGLANGPVHITHYRARGGCGIANDDNARWHARYMLR
jgi:hypothetical protein